MFVRAVMNGCLIGQIIGGNGLHARKVSSRSAKILGHMVGTAQDAVNRRAHQRFAKMKGSCQKELQSYQEGLVCLRPFKPLAVAMMALIIELARECGPPRVDNCVDLLRVKFGSTSTGYVACERKASRRIRVWASIDLP